MKNKILLPLIAILLISYTHDSFARMRLKSEDIKVGRRIGQKHGFDKFSCGGENKSPQLSILKVPKEAKSIAITMHDSDINTGSGWWHWIVYNIDPSVTNIDTGAKEISDNAVFGKNDFGTYGYGGPCIWDDDNNHRYIISLYALDVEKLDLPENPSSAMIGYYLNKHAIRKSELDVVYRVKKESFNSRRKK